MSQPFRIAIAGLGTVGCGTVRMLHANADLIARRAGRPVQFVAVSARDPNKPRDADVTGAAWVDDVLDLVDREDVDAVVELIGGAEGLAHELCAKALAAGKSVITANKAMIATHGAALAMLAHKHNAGLAFEAAVAGGIPILKTIREALAGNRLVALRGILNGTCNYILTRMDAEGLSFEDVLADAQKLGYAEADPSADVEGLDAAHKLAILAALSFGLAPDLSAVTRRGLYGLTPTDFLFAKALGCKIKLIGSAQLCDKGLQQTVEPCLVPLASPLAHADGVLNAIEIEGNAAGPLFLSGRGAGGEATASAVLGDIVDLARGCGCQAWSVSPQQLTRAAPLPASEQKGCWYLRVQAKDQAGALALIADAFAQENISIASALQPSRDEMQDHVPFILTTHETNLAAVGAVTQRLEGLSCICEKPVTLKIEDATLLKEKKDA